MGRRRESDSTDSARSDRKHAHQAITRVGFRDRVTARTHEAPDQLLANPENWRIHSHLQEQALEAVLDEVGWVRGVLVNDRTGHMLDGHLRVLLAIRREEPTVPVDHCDLTEQEERIVLATLDPLAAMAGTDKDKLASLVKDLSADAKVEKLLTSMRERSSSVQAAVEQASSKGKAKRCPSCGRTLEQAKPKTGNRRRSG